jgi:hypothetical protein
MRQSLARFSASVSSFHAPSWADFITTTLAFRFSVHTAMRGLNRFPKTQPRRHANRLANCNDQRIAAMLLTLARSREFPDGSSRHGYDFLAPRDPQGHIDPILWKKYRDYCRVRRFWADQDDEIGRLVHKPGGAEHARWVFDYNSDADDDDEAGYRFGSHAFLPGEYVSISGQDDKLHTFRVVAVDPVVLSVELIKSFELESRFDP